MGETFWGWYVVFALAYIVGPAALIWGWIRFIRERPQSWTLFSVFSFVGFVLASLSALYGIWIIFYASSNGFGTVPLQNRGYAPDYELFYRCVKYGARVSLAALLFALIGVWRKGTVRWQSLISAIGTFAFWVVATTWP